MNSKTKIVVIHMKELIIGGIILIAALIAVIGIIMNMVNGGDSKSNVSSQNTSGTNSIVSESESQSTIQNEVTNSQTTNTNTIVNTYTPGVYTASVSLDGNPVDIQVTVDKNNINSIELIQVSDAVTTMYPLIQTNFDEIANLVMKNGTTSNITLNSDNKYTSSMLLNAIQKALDKCVVK